MGSLNDRVAALSAERRIILERYLQRKKLDLVPDKIPIRANKYTPVPLSFAQQRLWFLDQLEPGHSFYNLPFAMRLSGPLALAKLEQSLNAIIARHEGLRTSFIIVNGGPMQVVAPDRHVVIKIADLSSLPEGEREVEAARLAQEEGHAPFDLEHDLLLRTTVLRLSPTDHVLLLTMHHIVSDGWSMGVFYRELSALYSAFCSDQPFSLPELKVQYADFALWQRSRLQGETLNRLLTYWKKQLAGVPPLLELPTDRPRPQVQVFEGAAYTTSVPKALLQQVKALGVRSDATLFMVLLAAFNVLLLRYSRQQDVLVGCPVANRIHAELEGLIGFFVNTLVLRTDLSGNPTFLQLISRVRTATIEAFTHQDIPFDKLVQELHPERNLSHNPLFQVMFALQNNEGVPQMSAQSTVPQFSVGTSKFDLTLSIADATDGLVTHFEYNSWLFDKSTIVSLSDSFRSLLESGIDGPDRQISELQLLSPMQRQQLVAAFRGLDCDLPNILLIHAFCEVQAQLQPDAPAVRFGGEQLSYRQLNARANQFARFLRSQNVQRETLVALCVDRSFDMVVGMFGILKAGAAYVPLDPTYPKDRLAYILDDSQATVLVTQMHLIENLPVAQRMTVCLDADWPAIAIHQTHDLEPLASPDNLAYVIYTSGSTGQPKGVMVQHQGICNLAEAQSRIFGVMRGERVLQFASLSFDASVWEIIMALRAGAILSLVPNEKLLPGALLIEVLREERINVLTITPSALAALQNSALRDLRVIICAGEACPEDLAARWAPGRRFFNAYGPTEGSVCTTIAEYSEIQTMLLIGRPILNTQTYLLDEYLEPVPIGAPGEIFLGGIGVSRGYHLRPQLTAERYLPDPFGITGGGRLYRTGDCARFLASGDIQFLGRIDHQVKIRGYRIELGEIENCLLQHPDVREAAAMIRPMRSGEMQLVACYVSAPERMPDASELRSFLRRSLPEFMVPSLFFARNDFPRNANGKLDRAALLAANNKVSGIEESALPPRTPTEKQLLAIWSEILEREHIGINDNFFELGGHSLLATRVVSRMNSVFQLNISLRMVFELPTIAELAESIDVAISEGRFREPAIQRIVREIIVLPVAAG